MNVGTDIHVPLRMDCNHFGAALTFHLGYSLDQSFVFSVFGLLTDSCKRFNLASAVLLFVLTSTC